MLWGLADAGELISFLKLGFNSPQHCLSRHSRASQCSLPLCFQPSGLSFGSSEHIKHVEGHWAHLLLGPESHREQVTVHSELTPRFTCVSGDTIRPMVTGSSASTPALEMCSIKDL